MRHLRTCQSGASYTWPTVPPQNASMDIDLPPAFSMKAHCGYRLKLGKNDLRWSTVGRSMAGWYAARPQLPSLSQDLMM